VEDVEETIEEVAETMELANEVNDALSNAAFGPILDEDELDEELGMLEDELEEEAQMEAELAVDHQMGHVAVPTSQVKGGTVAAQLPQVPTGAVKKKTAEEQELDDLEALMGL